MKAGSLRHRVTIQAIDRVQNELGESESIARDSETVWAAVEPLQGRELFVAQQYQADVTTRIRMRYGATVTPRHQLVYRDRKFNVVSIINIDERDREIHLMCKEVV